MIARNPHSDYPFRSRRLGLPFSILLTPNAPRATLETRPGVYRMVALNDSVAFNYYYIYYRVTNKGDWSWSNVLPVLDIDAEPLAAFPMTTAWGLSHVEIDIQDGQVVNFFDALGLENVSIKIVQVGELLSIDRQISG